MSSTNSSAHATVASVHYCARGRSIAMLMMLSMSCGDSYGSTNDLRSEVVADADTVEDGANKPLKSGGTNPPTAESSEAESCAPDVPAFIELSWADVPVADDAVLQSAGFRLRVRNVSGGAIDVELNARADVGAQDSRKFDVTSVSLVPGAEELVNVDLNASGLSFSDMKFSGRAHVTAVVHDLEAGTYRHAISPPVFYHPASGGGLVAYSELTLQAKHGGGDFANSLALEAEPGAVVDRVIYGGAGQDVLAQPVRDKPPVWYKPAEGKDARP